MKKKCIEYHRDGSIHAKGTTANGAPDGYWEWFRLNGTRMRSVYIKNGNQSGKWTTYDRNGKVVKVTDFG